ncbi:MAG: MoxR family ATPase [Chloroflexi bacterium]|nr:MoxR family ATPase [Chloroflexota bacterium]MCI0773495.1 MoxR family ATPase [Chloroflexota bacterium]MCI0805927.1 MoxR family ATPase [Chloroflexota bacterium]MCI0827655.1 MoxR family ATPase [Chloroflexota bacterium]MCI0853107.1 MoxR family ATPase [Chloroflexota bacterium]
MPFDSIDELKTALQDQLYLADRGLATAIFLSLKLERPLFLEGEAGVGKTEVAKALARALDTELIRLQCYEGLDVHHAVYEWNYTRQMLHIRMLEARGERPDEKDLFGSEFLLRRPLLQAITWEGDRAPVLLIDELDRSDEEFEAFLLEILSEFQVTIPEIGTIRAERAPIVVITSNRTREVHDALKRRCLYHWIDYPTFQREFDILKMKLPEAPEQLTRQVTAFVQKVREADLYKVPGVAESLDWAEALWTLDQEQLDPEIVDASLGALLKYQDDVLKIRGAETRAILAEL